MKKQIILAGALCMGLLASAENIDVKSFRYAGPFVVQQPYLVDSVDVNSRAFAMKNLLDTPLSFEQLSQSSTFEGEVLPKTTDGYALHLVGFHLQNNAYTEAKLDIKGIANYQLFVDGRKQAGGSLTLEPATHEIVIKYLS